jgi:hypothetical protein
MGYPGKLATTVTYTLEQKNELRINYHATTDGPTVINLTNHSYFNLAGEDTLDAYNQRVSFSADNYTPTDPTHIPTGQIAPVKGTPFDFTSPTAIGAHITANDPQLLLAQGYDHNWVINRGNNTELVKAARAEDRQNGTHPDRLHNRARCAVLHVQLHRRGVHGHQRAYLPAGREIHDGDPALCGFAESPELSDHHAHPGPNLRFDNGFRLQHRISAGAASIWPMFCLPDAGFVLMCGPPLTLTITTHVVPTARTSGRLDWQRNTLLPMRQAHTRRAASRSMWRHEAP